MQDLSNLLGDPVNVLAPTSQAGGNQVFSNDNAHTAPGSLPASPALSADGEIIDHPPPKIVATGRKIPPGTDGKPKARAGEVSASHPTWKNTH